MRTSVEYFIIYVSFLKLKISEVEINYIKYNFGHILNRKYIKY